MNNQIENLKDLFVEQGRELYSASMQEQKELPEIRRKVSSEELGQIIDMQIDMAKNQSGRLQQAFKKIDVNPEGESNECCQSIFKQTNNLIERSKDSKVRDAAIINSVQRLNHNKIAGFGSLSSYAREIGQNETAASIHDTLNEEKAIDQKLSELAERDINRKAAAPMV